MTKSCIIVALDYADVTKALELVSMLEPSYCRLKVGKELFTRGGPTLVEKLIKQGFDVFLDLKFHDIPHTVAQACSAAADLGVWMLNVHALGGRKMMEAARTALLPYKQAPLLVAVTVLTSLDENDVAEIGLSGSPAQNVTRLAALAKQSGMDGVVCSAHEASSLRHSLGQEFCLVTPGIRPRDSANDDQKRTMSPAEALRSGADYLVIGRPITTASDPMQALLDIQAEVATVTA